MAASAHHSSSMRMLLALFLLAATIASSPSRCDAQQRASSCASHTFSGGQLYPSCAALQRLGTTLHYNYSAATSSVAVAFRAPMSKAGAGGWVAWGLNPNGTGMVGAQAVVAFRHSNGTLVAYPTVLDSYAPSMAPADDADVSGVSTEYAESGEEMIVYATVALPGKGRSKFNHVWQQGDSVVKDVPAAHPTTGDNILSTGTIDFSK